MNDYLNLNDLELVLIQEVTKTIGESFEADYKQEAKGVRNKCIKKHCHFVRLLGRN